MPSYPVDSPGRGWETLSYPDGVTLPTDGVIVLRGLRHSFGEAATKTGVSVTVTDPAAQEVPGKLWVEPSYGQWPAVAYVVWKPNAPLQAGVTYSVAWHADALPYGTTIDGTTTFEVADAVALLPELQTTTPTSDRTNALTGPRVSCQGSRTCNDPPPFGSIEIQPYGMRFTVKPPSDPDTYQALSVEEVPGKGSFAETYDTPWAKRRKVMAAPWLEAPEMTAWFQEELPEYCVRLVQRDLRSGAEREQELCVPRVEQPTDAHSPLEARLANCTIPPDELLQQWCEINPTREQCAVPPSDSGATDSAGCGCRVENRGPAQSAFLFGVLATLLWRRRNNTARRATANTP
jgi:MYXO-CTERM domain-containing protein